MRKALFYIAVTGLLFIVFRRTERPLPSTGDSKYQSVMALPDGIEVSHQPGKVYAVERNTAGHRYTWLYSTKVNSSVGELSIIEFGSFAQIRNKWVFSNISEKPFTAQQFAEWYACSGAKLKSYKVVKDPQNWSAGDELVGSSTLWYYIGQDSSGKKFKGIGLIEQLPQLINHIQGQSHSAR